LNFEPGKYIALDARGNIFRFSGAGGLARIKPNDLNSFESRTKGLTRIEYFRNPFISVIGVSKGQIISQMDMPPSTFYPLSPMDYVESVRKLVTGQMVYPIQLSTTLSERCNFRCQICFNINERQARDPADISAESYIKTLEFLLSQNPVLAQNISTGGSGESIFHPDFLKLLDYSGDKGIFTFITTNGSRQDLAFAQSAARNLSIATISIHGIWDESFRVLENPPVQITLQKILNNVGLISSLREKYGRQKDLLIGVTSIVHPANTGHYIEFVKKLAQSGVDYVNFNPILPNLNVHGIRFTDDEIKKTDDEFAGMDEALSGSKIAVRLPSRYYDVEQTFYFDPSARLNPGVCLVSMLQPGIHPLPGRSKLSKVTACRFYPDVTNNPEFWYTQELGRSTFETIWTNDNITRIQDQTRRCKLCSSQRQFLALDWMLYIKRTVPDSDFLLVFPADYSL